MTDATVTTGAGATTPTAAQRWRGLRPGVRVLLAAGAAVVAVNAGLAGIEAVTGGAEPGGPPSSSYATAPEGLAAYADLLAARGHPVGRLRTGLDRAGLDPAETLVVADADGLTPQEAAAVARFVAAGGRLVATGRGAGAVVGAVLGRPPTWSPAPAPAGRPLAPVAEVAGVARVATAGAGTWERSGPLLPVLAGPGGVLASVAPAGEGRVVAVADTSVLQNRLLDEADNAAFGLAAAGAGRAVRFAEAHHGYGAGRGFAALPSRWRWSLAGAAVAVLVWLWSRGRRLGPPEDLERPLPPPRRAYVDAVAATLSRTGRPGESMAPLQAAVRRRLEQRAGLPADAGDEALSRAAGRLGLPAADLAAVLGPVTTDDDAMAAGRALAHLEGRTG